MINFSYYIIYLYNIMTFSERELELINNIHDLDLLDIIKKNKNLSFEFIVNYILNEKYQVTRKEKNITIDTVANYQPHLIPRFLELLKG